MLGFYLDVDLTQPVSRLTPKRFLVPEKGGTTTTSLWLGDPGAAGTTYTFDGNLTVRPFGANPNVRVALKKSIDTSYGFVGSPLLFAQTTVLSAKANAVRVDVQLTVVAGEPAELVDWGLETNGYHVDLEDPLEIAQADGYVYRRDQSLLQRVRTLPAVREVAAALPGFRVGEHRWRDAEGLNARTLVPTRWDPDVHQIGVEKFIAGIGDNDDLQPVQIEEIKDSLKPRIRRGHYFTGPNGYFLPAQPVLEFLRADTTTHVLAAKPRRPFPVFVGTYQLDSQGFYEKEIEFRRVISVPIEDPGYDWFHFNPTTRALTLSRTLPARTVFLGLFTDNAVEYFDLPVYPVDLVTRVYVDRGLGEAPVPCPVEFKTANREAGTLVVPKPVGALSGDPVYAEVNAAIAVLYDTAMAPTRLLEVDVNPAFAGIAGGYIYLQHRRQKANAILLACDKPYIAIPPAYAGASGLVAYGPVYFDGDYALLTATAYSKVTNEIVPNTRLQVVVDPDEFSGLLNYKDPLLETIEVVTGGDGTANLVFIPKSGFGVYLPTTLSNGTTGGREGTTTLVLPETVPLSQIWNEDEGWLVTAYAVHNNNPLLGTAEDPLPPGAIAWATAGASGAADYRTNGMRVAFAAGETLTRPVDALDENGVSYTVTATFTGNVKKLVYAADVIPVPDVPEGRNLTVAAYFITYLQRVTLQLKAVESNVVSNTILLEMTAPVLIDEEPWLIVSDDTLPDTESRRDHSRIEAFLDATTGQLRAFRLGWESQIPFTA